MNPAPENEGWILVQPETVARTLDELDDLIATARVEAEAVANMDGGEWTIRQATDDLQLAKGFLLQAIEMDDMATVQWMVAQLEEVEA